MIAPLVLVWILHLAPPSAPPPRALQALADGIAEAASEDPAPLDAAALLVAVAYYESRFDLNAVSDHRDPTVSVGAFQLSVEWIRLPASPYIQAKTALGLMRDSQLRCGSLAMYASGQCDAGRIEGDRRARLAARLLQWKVEPREPAQPKRRGE